jgi:hypothetical protein
MLPSDEGVPDELRARIPPNHPIHTDAIKRVAALLARVIEAR